MQESFSLGENLLASVEGLCFMESFICLALEGLVAHAADWSASTLDKLWSVYCIILPSECMLHIDLPKHTSWDVIFSGATASLGVGHLSVEVSRSHTIRNTHKRAIEFLSMSDQPVAKRPLPTQHTTNTRDEQPCPQRHSNPLSLQSSGRKLIHWTAQAPGSATIEPSPAKLGPFYCNILQGGRLKIIAITRRTVTGSLNQLNVPHGFTVCMSQIPFSIISPSLLACSTRYSNFRVTRPEILNVNFASTVELRLSGRWLSGSAWPFG